MKLSYKTTVPTVLLLLSLIIFVSLLARYAVEEAILVKEVVRIVQTTENALLPEIRAHEEDEHIEEEEEHAEAIPGGELVLILSAEDFSNPADSRSQARFLRYIQEFKDPEIERVILWSKDFRILSATESNLIGRWAESKTNLEKVLTTDEPHYLKYVDREGIGHLDIFAPLYLNDLVVGIVETRLSTDQILGPIKQHLNNIMLISASAGAFTLLAIFLVNYLYAVRAERLSRNKEEFFAIASHEMRTPLSAIKESTGLILNYWPKKEIGEEDMLKFVQQAHDSSVRLIQIANDYIDTLRIEQGKPIFVLSEVNICEIVVNVVAEIKEVAQQKGLQLVYEKAEYGDSCLARGDKERVKQVVYNLISNAIHYTKEGSITVKVSREDNSIKVTVADTGMGIPLENQDMLFHKFQQAGQNVLSREVSLSVGMGLYICKLLVDNMKGKIGLIKSEPGKGSEFYFSLPAA